MGGIRRDSVYVSIILWFSEREYVYSAQGPLLYYTIGGSLFAGG